MIIDLNPEPVTVSLECDDSAAPIRWTLRPLTGSQLARARQAAGVTPVRGRMVLRDLAARIGTAGNAAAEFIKSAIDAMEKATSAGDVAVIDDARAVLAAVPRPTAGDLNADAMGTLCASDVVAHDEAMTWLTRRQLEVAAAALVAVDGAPVDDARAVLESIRPASVQLEAVSELAGHAEALSELPPKARDSYAWRCGSCGTPDEPDGSASTAHSPPPTSTPEADAVGL